MWGCGTAGGSKAFVGCDLDPGLTRLVVFECSDPPLTVDVVIRVADVPGLPAVGTGAGDAYRLIVSADLLDSTDARIRSAGEALLRRVLCCASAGPR